MLESLEIKNFVVAEDVNLSFAQGLNALLGETGAGKSVIVEALAVACGAKVSLGKVRDEGKRAFLQASFRLEKSFVEDHPELSSYLEEDGMLLLSASIAPKGSVVRKVNGQTVTQGMLKDIGGRLLDIHSQGNNATLFAKEGQLKLIDSYGRDGIAKAKEAFSKAYDSYLESKERLSQFLSKAGREDPEFLRYRIKEIETFHLEEDEIEEAEEKLASTAGGAKASEALSSLARCYEACQEAFGQVKSSLFDFRGTPLENKAKEAKEALAMAEEKIEDLVSSAPEVDPQEVDRLNRRLYDLGELRRKYGKKTSDILASLKDFKERLEALQTFEEDKARKESEVEAKRREAVSEAEALSRERKKVAADLSAKVCDEMSHLGLSKGGFRISFHERAEMCAEGKDEAIYEVCLNKGFRFAPLSEAASGGEGSRLMLSLKAVLQKANPCDCLIFDEIDSGISGKVAFKAGRMMRDLSGDVQILCITHLPQVACFADRGIEVKKTDGGDKAIAVAEVLTSDGLATAVATMLGGENPTRESRRAAEELIREASSGKSDP